ncbi:MAG: CHASE3 domain-containing protein, partial [Pseudobdellovibrionaceae bacterium]|nr:CHASE3 domain-containing protein [Pseudobdellovibrionaceae bacterium]
MKLPHSPASSSFLGLKLMSGKTLTLAAAVIMVLILGNLAILYSSLKTVRAHNHLVNQSHEILHELSSALLALRDTEGSVRSYVSGRQEPFLQSLQMGRTAALLSVRTVKNLTVADPEQRPKAEVLWDKSLSFMRWQSDVIEAARLSGGGEPTAAGHVTGLLSQAMRHMDEIRLIVQDMKDTENRKLKDRSTQAETATYRQELSILVVAGVNVLLVLLVQYYIRRSIHLQRAEGLRLNEENWLKTGLAEAGTMLRGKDTLEDLGRAALEFFARYLGMQVGAFYVLRHGGLQRTATFA